STTALYNKLDRVETGVSAALVRDSATLVEPGVKALRASHPGWLPGYQIKVLDGNHLSSTEHRLKALRGTWAAPVPWPSLGGVGPAAHVDYGCLSERRWACAGASLDCAGAPPRQRGATLDRGSQLLYPRADVWHGPPGCGVRRPSARSVTR